MCYYYCQWFQHFEGVTYEAQHGVTNTEIGIIKVVTNIGDCDESK